MKTLCLVLCGCGVVGLILCATLLPSLRIKKAKISTFWMPPLLAATLLILTKCVSLSQVTNAFFADTSVNPLKILVLFLSVTAMSVFLDEAGFFEILAYKTLHCAKSQNKLFAVLFVSVSVLTVFTSNDIVVLTFTPFICYFAKNAKINALPYLVAEFVAANLLSMMLVVGNPTNIYFASSFDIAFGEYFFVMALPSVAAAVCAFFVLRLMFAKQLKSPLTVLTQLPPKPKNKFFIVLGIVHLALCTIMLAISSYIKMEMWYICLAFAVSLCVIAIIYSLATKQKPCAVFNTAIRIPWQLIPFVLSMFVLVLGLDISGFTQQIATFLMTSKNYCFSFGVASFLSANVLNNIPMSVLFASVCEFVTQPLSAVYAGIVGSNIGALLTPVGALAGLMWTNILKKHDIKIGLGKFVFYCGSAAVVALIAALSVLSLQF